METLGQARTMLVDLRHFAGNPDIPIQRNPRSYLQWLRSLGTSRPIATAIAPMWGPTEMTLLADSIFPPTAPVPETSADTITPPSAFRGNREDPCFQGLPRHEEWDHNELSILASIRAALESQTPLRVQVATSVDQDLFIQIRRQNGGISNFIAGALEEFLVNPEAVFIAAGRLAERRNSSPSKPTITGRVSKQLASQLDALMESYSGKVARITTSKVVGGCALLRAEQEKLI